MPEFCVILPCFNERNAITDGVHAVYQVLDENADWEIIVVDDGSDDGSAELLDKLKGELKRLRVFTHEDNRGYGAALKTGIHATDADWVVITDADGTYPASHIPQLIAEAKNVDMVVGARTGEKVASSVIRNFAKLFLTWYCSWITKYRIPDINSGMRVLKKTSVEKYFTLLPDTFSFTTTITIAMLSNNHEVKYIPVNYNQRIGASKIRPIRDTLNFIQLIFRTGSLFAPMRTFMPFIILFGGFFVFSALYDALSAANLTDTTILLFILFQSTFLFAILADLIRQHCKR
ncbi:MAG: glycosyl transferase family 2 [Magnetovibrio sp.]|nr:glycosyl transferase family 2 [Magnetovibrio sp.]